jgi:hypothetical protein
MLADHMRHHSGQVIVIVSRSASRGTLDAMRLTVALIVAIAALLPSSATAAYYVGEGEGISVEMRIRFAKISYARVETTLYCTPRPILPGNPAHTKPLRLYVSPNAGDDATSIYNRKIPIGRRGEFRFFSRSNPLDETGSSELIFSGQVSGPTVLGRFRDRALYDEGCRTGGFLPYGERDPGMETLHFTGARLW